jgi:hypothetical protein
MKKLREATYETLRSAGVSMHVKDIYAGVKRKVPRSCNDKNPCTCGAKHPLWKHKMLWALIYLKGKGLIKHTGKRGFWVISKL